MTNDSSKDLSYAWVLLLILTLIWGSSFILIKRGLDAFSANEVGALRIVAAAVVMIPTAFRKVKSLKRQHWFWIFSVGFFGSMIPSFLFAIAETRLDSSIAGVLNALTPMFTVIFGIIFFHQYITKRIIIGLIIGFGGTLLLVSAGVGGFLTNLNYYALYILLATLFYGFNVNIIKYKLSGVNALTLTSLSMLFVLPIALYYLLVHTPFITTMETHPLAWDSFFYVVLLGIMSTAVAMTMFNKLVQISSTIFASSVTYLIPIIAVIWGLIDNEILLLQHYIGMLVILIGVYITNRK
jgi:drug/metabolite transporter (DMT)-like permease